MSSPHARRASGGGSQSMVGAHISTSSFLLSYKKNCLLLPFRCFPIMSSLNKTFCATTTRYSFYDSYNVRSHVFSIVSARAQTRLFRLLFVFERVVFWQEHQHHQLCDDLDANKKGDDDAHQNRSGIIIIIDRRRIRRRRFHRRHRTALKKRQKQSQTRFKKSSAER